MSETPRMTCLVHPVHIRKTRWAGAPFVRVTAADAALSALQPAANGLWESCEWAAMLLPGTAVPAWLRGYLHLPSAENGASGITTEVIAVPVTAECSLHVAAWSIPWVCPVLRSTVGLSPISDAHWVELGAGKALPSPSGVDVAGLLGLNTVPNPSEDAPAGEQVVPSAVAELLLSYDALSASEAAAFRRALRRRA